MSRVLRINKNRTINQESNENCSLFLCSKNRKEWLMTNKEQQVREAIINFLVCELNISREESIASLKELEEYGLVKINSNGEFLLREV